MRKLPECRVPEDLDAWQAEISGIKRLPQPDEQPSAPLILKEIEPSLRMEGVYNANSFTLLEVGDTSNLDGKTAERFRKGQFKIDARLDLHGRTEKEAFTAVEDFIRSSYISGARCVLIITGKGVKRENDAWYEPKGIIRDALPKWLNHPDIRPLILSMVPARREDGGSGAVYVLLKRQRGLQQSQQFQD